MNKNIKITIESYSGCGKTHLAAYLYRILNNEGFDVLVNDIDLTDENLDSMGTYEPINSIKNSVSLSIQTKQLLRDGSKKDKAHPSHNLEWRDSSHYEYVCLNCNTADSGTSGWGKLLQPCPTFVSE
jgi:CO dehydrogenase nickel-insertion accessory protein CooC1